LSWKTSRAGARKPAGEYVFFGRNAEGISKLAFVGDEKWKVEIFMFTGKPMRHTAIEYFPQDQFDQAQAWLSEENLPAT